MLIRLLIKDNKIINKIVSNLSFINNNNNLRDYFHFKMDQILIIKFIYQIIKKINITHKIHIFSQLIIKKYEKTMIRICLVFLKKKYLKVLKEVQKYLIFRHCLILITHKDKSYNLILTKIFIINK